MPVPEREKKIAQQLYQRRSGITVAELAAVVELERHQVQNGLPGRAVNDNKQDRQGTHQKRRGRTAPPP